MEPEDNRPAKKLNLPSSNKVYLICLAVAILLGTSTGYFMSRDNSEKNSTISETSDETKTAQADNQTFRDFAEGKIVKKDTGKSDLAYSEGTHLLMREGAVPVALTSSVVDLSEYEEKNVKVFGETQKAIKEGWLMDVGRVEVK